MAGRAKENLPGGSLKYLFIYFKIRIFKCSYRIYAEMVDGVEVFNWVVIGMKTLTNQMEHAPASLFSHRATQFDPACNRHKGPLGHTRQRISCQHG